MFAIIAALWSLWTLYVAISNWGYIRHQVFFHSKSYSTAFTSWLIGSLVMWLVPIFLLKFFIYLFS